MAAVETFHWIAGQSLLISDAETKRFIDDQRDYFLTIRSEDERLRCPEVLISQISHLKKRRRSA